VENLRGFRYFKKTVYKAMGVSLTPKVRTNVKCTMLICSKLFENYLEIFLKELEFVNPQDKDYKDPYYKFKWFYTYFQNNTHLLDYDDLGWIISRNVPWWYRGDPMEEFKLYMTYATSSSKMIIVIIVVLVFVVLLVSMALAICYCFNSGNSGFDDSR